MHPFRFGISMTEAASAETLVAVARRAEELGYDILLMPDHMGRQLSPIAGLMAAAAATTRLRIGSLVLVNDFRNPLIVAREAATLDVLSGGRFELGLGAGWDPADYLKLGLPHLAPSRRVDRLDEAVPLVKRLLAGETVDHHGEHYRMTGAHIGLPPSQVPRPPLHIGAGGPRMLRLAGREADIVGLHAQVDPTGRALARQASPATIARKIAIVREAAGPRYAELEFSVMISRAVLIGRWRHSRDSLRATTRSAVAELAGRSYVLFGTLRRLEDRLRLRRDNAGISYYVIPRNAMEEMAPLVAALAGR